jgi:tRNA 2-(methylsulfanyl)-N6-isopentenyladenosine37 hydroxylase
MTTLGLDLPTDPRWVDIAAMNLGEVLIDHAWCEQKAASACVSLIVQNSDRTELVEVLTPIVAEEWGHFQRVLRELKKRNIPLGRARKDLYVNELRKHIRTTPSQAENLAEQLLLNALIEARSCERFKLLSEQLTDDGLRRFYRELMISEAGHYRTFIELAETYWPADRVRARWKEILHLEAQILQTLELRGDRMH